MKPSLVRSPRPGGAAYAASKAAVEIMSKVFAMELGPLGIRVNVVAPGYIDVRGWSDAYPDGTLLDMPAAAWDRVFAVNVTGTFMLTQAFARHCAARAATGAVVSISTGSARSPRPGGAAYAASKAAVEIMSKVFAMELGPLGIRVNVVAPGYIDVRGWSDAYPDRAPEDLRAALVRSIPLGQAGDPRDIANAVLFLASAQAGHITGTVLEVDGGSNAGRYALHDHVTDGASGARG